MTKKMKKPPLELKVLLILFLCLFMSACGEMGDVSDLSTKEMHEQMKTCWTCQMFTNVFRAFGGIQDKSDGAYGKGETGLIESVFTETYAAAKNLLLVAFALWLLFVTGKLMISPGELPSYLSKLLKKTLFVVFGVILLSKPEGIHTVMTFIVFPIFSMFIELAVQIVDSGAGTFGEGGNVTCTVGTTINEMAAGTTSKLGEWEFTGQFNDFFKPLKCFLELIHKQSVTGSVQAWRIIDSKEGGLGALLIGLTLLGMFWLMNILLALSITDAVFTVGVVLILVPLLIVAWIFEISRGYVKPAFAAFLGACSQCAVVAIFLSYMTATFQLFADRTDKRSVTVTLGELEYNFQPILEQGIAIQEDGPVWSMMFMMLIMFLGMSKMSDMLGNIIGSKSNMFASIFKQTVAIGIALGASAVTFGKAGVAAGMKYAASKTAIKGAGVAKETVNQATSEEGSVT